MTDSDEILFLDEEPSGPAAEEESPWKILIVDDEADVHGVTAYMLSGRTYEGRAFHPTLSFTEPATLRDSSFTKNLPSPIPTNLAYLDASNIGVFPMSLWGRHFRRI